VEASFLIFLTLGSLKQSNTEETAAEIGARAVWRQNNQKNKKRWDESI